MFDDLPKKSPFRTFIFILLFLIIIAAGGLFGYQKITATKNKVEPKVLPTQIVDTSSPVSLTPTPTFDYKIPAGETFTDYNRADTNGDNLKETLILTKQENGSYHFYILSADGKTLFDHKNLPAKPLKISTKIYEPTKEKYYSWLVTMSETQGDQFFVHFNGTAYEIPQAQTF